jgi:outer membrane immunogenic protein
MTGRLGALTVGAFTVAAALIGAVPASAGTWAGTYIGVNVGGGMANGQFSDGCYFCATDNYDPPTFAVGGQLGVNWQTGAFVYGLEGSVDWDTMSHHGILGTDDYTFVRDKANFDWDASIRARAGIAVDNAFMFVTAGPAFGGISTKGIEYSPYPQNPSATPTGYVFNESNTRIGFSAGMGVEFWWDESTSLGFEYLYTNFGSETAVRAPSAGSCSTNYICEIHNSLTTQSARLTLNWHM